MTKKDTYSALFILAIGLCWTIGCVDEDKLDGISDEVVEEQDPDQFGQQEKQGADIADDADSRVVADLDGQREQQLAAAAIESSSCSVAFLSRSCVSGSVAAHPTDHSLALTVVCPVCNWQVRDVNNGRIVRSGIGHARTRIRGLFSRYRVEITQGVFGNWAFISNVDP